MRRYIDWRDWFRPAKAQAPELPTAHEAKVISAWGLTFAAWNSLTDVERAERRFNYLKAPRYVA